MRPEMEICTVGVMSPGDMGHAVGKVLWVAGRRVITCLDGRSARTVARSTKAGIIAVTDDLALVRESDVILSILHPAHAVSMAERIAVAVQTTGTDLLYVDCNAIAPRTSSRIGDLLVVADVRYVDGGIIGEPPASSTRPTRLYVSSPDAPAPGNLETPELQVRVVGPSVGQASGLKMCYAALTKGLTAVATEALASASALGLDEPVRRELLDSCWPGSTAPSWGCRPRPIAGSGRWRR
jgi:L-threonate 2-dehydrogenase